MFILVRYMMPEDLSLNNCYTNIYLLLWTNRIHALIDLSKFLIQIFMLSST